MRDWRRMYLSTSISAVKVSLSRMYLEYFSNTAMCSALRHLLGIWIEQAYSVLCDTGYRAMLYTCNINSNRSWDSSLSLQASAKGPKVWHNFVNLQLHTIPTFLPPGLSSNPSKYRKGTIIFSWTKIYTIPPSYHHHTTIIAPEGPSDVHLLNLILQEATSERVCSLHSGSCNNTQSSQPLNPPLNPPLSEARWLSGRNPTPDGTSQNTASRSTISQSINHESTTLPSTCGQFQGNTRQPLHCGSVSLVPFRERGHLLQITWHEYLNCHNETMSASIQALTIASMARRKQNILRLQKLPA